LEEWIGLTAPLLPESGIFGTVTAHRAREKMSDFGPTTFVVLGLYFIPALVAEVRKHHNSMAIGLLNFLLGWTVLGWIAALIWASTEVRSKEQRR
jgi:hypothetical protein